MEREGHGYCKFEGGHIFWDEITMEYREVTKLVAIVPIDFIDNPHKMPIEDLQAKANLVVSYYKQQSYDKEEIGYKIFKENNNWYRISENYLDIQNQQYQNPNILHPFINIDSDKYLWAIAMQEAGLDISERKIADWHLVYPIGYDVGMVVIPGYGPKAIVNPEGSGMAWVDESRTYGSWAHELGHALYGLRDMGGHEKYKGDIGYWGLMGLGWDNNPTAPIIGYNKINNNKVANKWIEDENIYKNDEKNIKLLEKLQPPNDKIYIYDTINNGIADYYIFEGRANCLKEGVLIFKIKDNKIYAINNVMKIIGPCYTQMTLTSPPWYNDYYDPIDGVKFKATFENNDITLQIKEYSPKTVKIFNTEYFLPDIGENGLVPEPIDYDIDLHVLTYDSKKVGMDYTTGEYLNEIEGAISSGNVGGGEWILIPESIDAEAYVVLTPELKELIKSDNTINVEVISTLIIYDENGNRKESIPISININSENVDSQLTLSLLVNITFLPPVTIMEQFNLTDGRTLPIKFTAKNSSTNEFIYDPTVNVTITNSTGHLIVFFTNGTDTDSVRINSTEEQYIVNFHTQNYDLNVGEIYTIHVTFGEADAMRGYAITHFTLV